MKHFKNILILVFTVLSLYGFTLHFPFIFDDYSSIVDNLTIRDFEFFKDPTHWLNPNFRSFSHLTLAINYAISALEPWSYRLTNILLHFSNAVLVYLLVLELIKKSNQPHGEGNKIALYVALLFVAHPLLTHGVSYLVQRMAALATFFYLIAFLSYWRFRLSPHFKYLLLFGLAFFLGINSKQTFATLPLLLLVAEWLFFKSRRFIIGLSISMLILAAVAMVVFYNPQADALNLGLKSVSRFDYFISQIKVLPIYACWVFVPYFIALDPILAFEHLPQALLLILGLLIFSLTVYLGISLFQKKKPLYLFGLLWIVISMLVESSFIPIRDALAAHRLYLPFFGIALISGLILHSKPKLFYAIALYLAIFTWQRNYIFSSPLLQWEDSQQKFTLNPRPHVNLGVLALRQNDTIRAEKHFLKAIDVDSTYHWAYSNLGQLYLEQGKNKEAIQVLHKSLLYYKRDALAYVNIGTAWRRIGVLEQALQNYNQALRLNPNLSEAYYNRGVIYEKQNRLDKALKDYQTAVKLKPASSIYLYNLGNVYLNLAQYSEAVQAYTKVLEVDSIHIDALNNQAIAYYSLGDKENAIKNYKIILAQSPDNQQAKQNLAYIMAN